MKNDCLNRMRAYEAPCTNVMEMSTEGVLCTSGEVASTKTWGDAGQAGSSMASKVWTESNY